MSIKKRVIQTGAALALSSFVGMSNEADVEAAEWQPRTVSEIRSDIQKQVTNQSDKSSFEYTFKPGDTLWAVSQATNISGDKLAQVNQIDNKNSIIAGNNIYLSENKDVVSVDNGQEVESYDISQENIEKTETPKKVEEEVDHDRRTNEESKDSQQQAAEEEQQRQEEAERRAAEEEQQRQEEAERRAAEKEQQRQEEAERRAAEKEQQRQEEAERRAAEKEQQRQEEAERRAAEKEQQRQEEAERRAAEEEQRRQEEAERRAAEEEEQRQEEKNNVLGATTAVGGDSDQDLEQRRSESRSQREQERIEQAELEERRAERQAEVEANRNQREKEQQSSNTGLVRPASGYTSSGFGSRWGSHHDGLDIAGGGSIVAAQTGTVVRAQSHPTLGNFVDIEHGNGYTTRYAHLSGMNVSAGQTVQQGQTLGTMGATGNATGVHLHFEVHQGGTPINPAQFF